MTILKNFVTENVESNTDMNDQLRAIKQKYYAVKKKFEQIKGRSSLVQHIQQMKDLSLPELPENVQTADKRLNADKKEMKSLNERLRQEKDELSQLITIISKEFEELQSKRTDYEDRRSKIVSEDNVLKEWSANKALYGNCNKEQLKMETVDDVENIISGQENSIQEVTIEEQRLEDMLRSLSQQLKQASAALKETEGNQVEESTVDSPMISEEELKMKETKLNKLTATMKKLEELRGVSVDTKDLEKQFECTVKFKCAKEDEKGSILKIYIDKDRNTITSASLCPESEPCSDILACAEKAEDFGFIVDEIRSRVSNCRRFKNELASLKKEFRYIHSVDFEHQMHKLGMGLNGDIDAELSIPLDYPMRHAKSVVVHRVSDIKSNFPKELLDTLNGNMKTWVSEQEKWNLADWIEKVNLEVGTMRKELHDGSN